MWQSLAYSLLGVVVPPPSEYLWNTPNYWSLQCLTAPLSSERRWTKRSKIIDASRATSYVLNSGFTEPYLIKFIDNIQKWALINVLKSELRYSKLFWTPAYRMTTIVILRPNRSTISTVLRWSYWTDLYQNFTRCRGISGTFYHMYTQGTNAFHFRSPEQRVKAVNFGICQNAPKSIGYHSNVP